MSIKALFSNLSILNNIVMQLKQPKNYTPPAFYGITMFLVKKACFKALQSHSQKKECHTFGRVGDTPLSVKFFIWRHPSDRGGVYQ